MQHASRSQADWLGRLSSLDIPVLRATRKALQKAWQQPDRVDANFLAEIILRDPLMTLRILAYASVNRSPRVVTPAETVCAAVLLMGINSFQRSFSELSVLEESLAGHRDALHHVRGGAGAPGGRGASHSGSPRSGMIRMQRSSTRRR